VTKRWGLHFRKLPELPCRSNRVLPYRYPRAESISTTVVDRWPDCILSTDALLGTCSVILVIVWSWSIRKCIPIEGTGRPFVHTTQKLCRMWYNIWRRPLLCNQTYYVSVVRTTQLQDLHRYQGKFQSTHMLSSFKFLISCARTQYGIMILISRLIHGCSLLCGQGRALDLVRENMPYPAAVLLSIQFRNTCPFSVQWYLISTYFGKFSLPPSYQKPWDAAC
jgi:hypothetical protein